MYIRKINLWHIDKVDAIGITTNGFVKCNGCAVMGRGIALQAKQRYPGIDRRLGELLRQNGNHVQIVWEKPTIFSFPVKPASFKCRSLDEIVSHARYKYRIGDVVPGFLSVARLDIIERSARELVELSDKMGWMRVALNFPGIGAGELKTDDVKKVVEPILDNRFVLLHL